LRASSSQDYPLKPFSAVRHGDVGPTPPAAMKARRNVLDAPCNTAVQTAGKQIGPSTNNLANLGNPIATTSELIV